MQKIIKVFSFKWAGSMNRDHCRFMGMGGLWGSFCFVLVLVFLNWGFEWKGLRPRLYSEAMGHATLLPFSYNLCSNMRPPSARLNAPMMNEYDFAKLGWWDCFIYIGTTWRTSKRVVAHLWNLLQPHFIVDRYRTNSAKHAHFIRIGKSSWPTSFSQTWINQP